MSTPTSSQRYAIPENLKRKVHNDSCYCIAREMGNPGAANYQPITPQEASKRDACRVCGG